MARWLSKILQVFALNHGCCAAGWPLPLALRQLSLDRKSRAAGVSKVQERCKARGSELLAP